MLDRSSAHLRECVLLRLTAQAIAAAAWRDVVLTAVSDLHLLPLHVQERAVAEALRGTSDRVAALLRSM